MIIVRYPRRRWLMGVNLITAMVASATVFIMARRIEWFMAGIILSGVATFTILVVWKWWAALDLHRMLTRDDLIEVSASEWNAFETGSVDVVGYTWKHIHDRYEPADRYRVEFINDYDRVMFLLNR